MALRVARKNRPPAENGPPNRVRIIGGKWRRSIVPVLAIPGLRPTPDRVRETAFNWILHACGGSLAGQSVLDAFCGSGALGLEAASRGAAPVVLADINSTVVASLKATLTRLKADGSVSVIAADASRLLSGYAQSRTRFAVIFLDPPFGLGWLERILPLAAAVLAPAGLVYIEAERELSAADCEVHGLKRIRADKAGQVFYHLLRRNIDATVA